MPNEQPGIAAELDVLKELEVGLAETNDDQVIKPGVEAPAPAEEPAKEPIAVEPEPEPPAAEETPAKEPGAAEEPAPEVATPTVTDDRDYKAEAEAERTRADAVERQLQTMSEKFLQQSITAPLQVPAVEQPAETPPVAAPAALPQPVQPAPATPDTLSFVNEEQHARMLEGPAGANAVYNAMYSRIVQDTMRAGVAIAQRAAKMEVYQERLNTRFYDENPELRPYSGYVRNLITDIAATKPELNAPGKWPELLVEAAKQARVNLPHLQKAEGATPIPTPAPAPAVQPNPTAVTKPPTSRQPVPQIDGLAKEIADLADLKY